MTGFMMYDRFNFVEALLWWCVAAVLAGKLGLATRRQRRAIVLGMLGFAVFGITDLLEIGTAGQVPLWLWGLKIVCGVVILSARYTWRGWKTFRWTDREFLFGLFCLLAVGALILLQRQIGSPG